LELPVRLRESPSKARIVAIICCKSRNLMSCQVNTNMHQSNVQYESSERTNAILKALGAQRNLKNTAL
ncbi:hypothetical protein NL526_29395, partial [Klebsiella pneumoniae]|nr:hypothetical protein [Klebsiella pneumoniae]